MAAIYRARLSDADSTGSFPLRSLKDIVKDFYENVKINEESTLGYKGGHIERDLDYVYTTPERNNAGRIYERLHYTVVVF